MCGYCELPVPTKIALWTESYAHDDQTLQPVSGGFGRTVKPWLPAHAAATDAGSRFGWLSAPPANRHVQKHQITLPVFASRQKMNPYVGADSPSPQPTYTRPFTTSGPLQQSAFGLVTGWLCARSADFRLTDQIVANVAAFTQ